MYGIGDPLTDLPDDLKEFTLIAGCGYWDVTTSPYGCDFRRAAENIPLVFVERSGKFADERKFRLPDGRLAIVRAACVMP